MNEMIDISYPRGWSMTGDLIKFEQEVKKYFGWKDNIILYVEAEIDGQKKQLTEPMVRFIQIKFANEIKSGAKITDLKKKYVIYSGNRHSGKKMRVMQWRKDGKFRNEFDGHFFNLCAELTFEIL